jgi:hypothetical protein
MRKTLRSVGIGAAVFAHGRLIGADAPTLEASCF